MKYGVGDRGVHADDADFTYAFDTERIYVVDRLSGTMMTSIVGHVRIYRDRGSRRDCRSRSAPSWDRFQSPRMERRRQAPDGAAHELAVGGHGIDDGRAGREGADDARRADFPGARMNPDLHEVRAEGKGGEVLRAPSPGPSPPCPGRARPRRPAAIPVARFRVHFQDAAGDARQGGLERFGRAVRPDKRADPRAQRRRVGAVKRAVRRSSVGRRGEAASRPSSQAL